MAAFPLQLSQGVIQELVSTELDALSSPSDEVKQAAFEKAKSPLAGRLALLVSKIAAAHAEERVHGFCKLVSHVWKLLTQHPACAGTEPSTLSSCLWLQTISSLFDAVCGASPEAKKTLCNGGKLVTYALDGFPAADEVSAERTMQLLPMLEWWSDEICAKRWGVTDAWGFCAILGKGMTPLHVIAAKNLAAFVPSAVDRGCPVNGAITDAVGASPALSAYEAGHLEVVSALLDHGLDLSTAYADGWPLAVRFVTSCRRIRKPFLEELLRRQPGIVTSKTSIKAPFPVTFLEAAIHTHDPEIVDLAISAGAPIEYRRRRKEGGSPDICPTLATAMFLGVPSVMKAIVEKGKALEGWKEKYDEGALVYLSPIIAKLAISAYPRNPAYTGEATTPFQYNPAATECVELILASGLVCPWDFQGNNSLLKSLYPRKANDEPEGCVLEEMHAMAVLQRFHAAGFEVGRMRRPSASLDPGAELFGLAHGAAAAGHLLVMSWALKGKNIGCILALLTKYKVKAAFPDKSSRKQPLVVLLHLCPLYTDYEAEMIAGALIERDPHLLDVQCFTEASIAAEEAAAANYTKIVSPWNPLFVPAGMFPRPRLMEFLLDRLPRLASMANRGVLTPYNIDGEVRHERCPPAQYAAKMGKWDCLDVLIRRTDARVTDIFAGTWSVHGLVESAAGKLGGPPRALVAAVAARAKSEHEEKAKTAAASQVAGAATNAFEDPSVRAVVQKEAKKKTKKKAAKKKANAKKRAAAAAAAGAGGAASGAACDDSSDDEDGDDDGPHEEEPGDNLVDSSNAPSLDLMLEQMGLKEKK